MDLKYQWTLTDVDGNRFTMLNTDMQLAYNIDVDNFGAGTECEVVVGYVEDDHATACICPSVPDSNYCDSSDTFHLVQTYANVSNIMILTTFHVSIIINTTSNHVLNLPMYFSFVGRSNISRRLQSCL